MNLFEGLKVIELAGVLAGPSVGMFFAELGATVIKVENNNGGDVTRSWKQPTENSNSKVSAYFSAINYKKQYLFVDLHDQNDLLKLHELIKNSDIVIANFKKGDDVKYQLDYHSLKKINPTLIYGQISGFGLESDRVAYDLILQAESGFMSMNGTQDSGPVKMPVALIDVLAGHQLKEGIMIALLNRAKNNKGSLVHVSLYKAAICSLMNQASNYLMTEKIPERIGSLHPNIAPYGEIFITEDNYQITFAIGSNQHFKTLCKLIEIENIATDEKFASNQNRVKNRIALSELIQNKISNLEVNKIQKLMHDNLIPFARIKNLQEVFEDKYAQLLIKDELIEGEMTKRVTGNAFEIYE